MDDDKVVEIIKEQGLPKYTEKSITDQEEFIKEIRNTRYNGYALDYEEYISGVRAVAVSIIGEKYQTASIYVVGFKASLDEGKMDLLKKEITRAAEKINYKLRKRL